MAHWITKFIVIEFETSEQASDFIKSWPNLETWCGLKTVHGPIHRKKNVVCGLIWDGCLDTSQVPVEARSIVIFAIQGEAADSHFEWPDAPRHPHLKEVTNFVR